jgi:hypothetical protein
MSSIANYLAPIGIQGEVAILSQVMRLGVLTTSIAHEVNQPLSGIVTTASAILRMLTSDPPNVEGARGLAFQFSWSGCRTARGRPRAHLLRSNLERLYGRSLQARREDQKFLAATYAQPGGMRAGFAQFTPFSQDAKDNEVFEQVKLTMPVLAVGGEVFRSFTGGDHAARRNQCSRVGGRGLGPLADGRASSGIRGAYS